MARHHDAPRIDARRGHQVIDGPLQAPRPRANGSALIRRVGRREESLQPALLRRVGINVAVVERRHRVAAVDHVLDPPDLRPRATAGLGRPVLHHSRAALRHPVVRQPHPRVVDQRVIAEVIHPKNYRRRRRALVGHHEHQVDRRNLRAGRNGSSLRSSVALPPKAVHVHSLDLAGNRLRFRRKLAVHVVLEQTNQLRSPLLDPHLASGDFPAIQHDQRIGQISLCGKCGWTGETTVVALTSDWPGQ